MCVNPHQALNKLCNTVSLVIKTGLKRSKYRILGLVGQGQFGRVFCAVHRQTGHLVAIKHLEQQRFPTNKFLRELRFLLSLKHPNIVMFHALEHTPTGRYLIMDYCEGGTLRSLMTDECQPTLRQSINLVSDILLGLEHAHNRGIVHCDIKPENILLSLEPHGWRARISDFGIAKLTQDIVEHEGNTGSPAYMAPERFYGQFSQASDLYSVGILLFELLAGYRPFSGTPSELMSAHLNMPLKLPDTIPVLWHPILIQSLQKLAARRYKSAGAMLADIRAASASLDSDAEALPSMPLHCIAGKTTWVEAIGSVRATSAAPIAALSVDSDREPWVKSHDSNLRIYQAIANQVIVESSVERGGFDQTDARPAPSITVSYPIHALELRPQGCFVIGDRTVDLVSTADILALNSHPRRVVDLPKSMWCSVEPHGQWITTLMRQSPTQAVLQFWATANQPTRMALPRRPLVQALRSGSEPSQLLALDSRHLALIFSVSSPTAPPLSETTADARSLGSPQTTSSTVFKIYTRRGMRVGTLTMPIHPRGLLTTPTPYRLVGIDDDDPTSILLIDLKPYRISRIALPISPKFLAVPAWGFIVADEQGHIILLDTMGQQVGWLKMASGITAIACLNHWLMVATWNGHAAELQVINLQESAVDMMF